MDDAREEGGKATKEEMDDRKQEVGGNGWKRKMVQRKRDGQEDGL